MTSDVTDAGMAVYAASFGQLRMWFNQRLEPESPLYSTPFAVRIGGPVDVAALQAAVDVVVARHEALRSRLAERDGMPDQVVDDAARVVVELRAAASWSAGDPAAFLSDVAAAAFDLTRAPLLRIIVADTGTGHSVLAVNAHHAVIDGWSFGVFCRELTRCYAAAAGSGTPDPLPELPLQYGDFAEWQHDVLRAGRWNDQKTFWQREFAGWPLLLSLPCDFPRPAVRTSECGAVAFEVNPETTAGLRDLARRLGGTVHMALMTAFQAVLSSVGGQERFAVGTTVSGRGRPALEGLIGLFVNTIPIRADCSGAPTFAALFDRVRRDCVRAYANQDLPFEEIVQAIGPRRDPAHTPVFQAVLTYCPHPLAHLRFPGVPIDYVPLAPSGGCHTDLDLIVYDDNDRLEGHLIYPSALFTADRVSSWVAALRELLATAPTAPETPLFAPHRAVAAPDETHVGAAPAPVQATTSTIAPSDELTLFVAEQWRRLTGREPAGIHADFFECGGDSLLAMRLLSRVEAHIGRGADLGEFLRNPTIAAVVAHLVSGRTRVADIIPAGPGPVPVSFGQHRMWFMQHLNPGAATYSVPYAVRVRGRLDLRALQGAVDAVVARHEALRTRITGSGDVPTQTSAAGCRVPVRVCDVAPEWDGSLVRAFVDGVIGVPFDLGAPPLLRIDVGRCGSDEHVLVVNMHHAATDGWSFGVLARELSRCYRAEVAGVPDPLPPLPVQYRDFAQWQRDTLASGRWDDQIAFWRSEHANWPVLELPTDRPRPPARTAAGETLSFAVSAETAAGVRSAAERFGVTKHTVVMAAYQTMLHRLSGQDRFTVGVSVAGRSSPAVADLIGFFANTLPVRVDFTGAPSPADVVARVHRDLLRSYANQDVPLDRIVKEVGGGRDPGRAPLTAAVLTYGPHPLADLSFPDGHVEPLPVLPRTARTDLTLEITDSPAPTGILEYSTELFKRSTAETYVAVFVEELDRWSR